MSWSRGAGVPMSEPGGPGAPPSHPGEGGAPMGTVGFADNAAAIAEPAAGGLAAGDDEEGR